MKNRIYNFIYMVISFYYEVKKRDESRPKLWFIKAATIQKIVLYATIYVVMKCFFNKDMIYAFAGLSLGLLIFDFIQHYKNNQ